MSPDFLSDLERVKDAAWVCVTCGARFQNKAPALEHAEKCVSPYKNGAPAYVLWPARPLFDGTTFDEEQDGERLTNQLARVKAYMLANAGTPKTLSEISRATRAPEASVSARIRDLRKRPHFFIVERVRVGPGLFAYSVKDPR